MNTYYLKFLAVLVTACLLPLASFSAYADITLNESRTFSTNTTTTFLLDDALVSENTLQQRGTGFVANINVANDVSTDFSSGTALTVTIDHLVKGPVTALSPLTVLGQAIIVTGDTALVDLPGNALTNLTLGDILEINGFADESNTIRATRIEFKPAGVPLWQLIGPISNLTNSNLFIGNQEIDFSGITPHDCDSGLSNTALVELKATPIANFSAGMVLNTLTDLECIAPGLADNTPNQLLIAEVEGLIQQIFSDSDFIVNGQRVQTTANTRFLNGSSEDIILGAKLEAEGNLNTTNGILTASKISFRDTQIRIEGPVAPDAVMPGESITIFGINITATPLTRDEDNILSAGLNTAQQVEIRGFLDRDNTVFASRVRERGDPDSNDVRLRGPIMSISNPSLVVLGVTIDTTNSTFRDALGNTLTASQFFSQISIGSHIQIENDASFDAISNTISGGLIEIKDSSETSKRLIAGNGVVIGGTGVGTITAISSGGSGNELLSDDFD